MNKHSHPECAAELGELYIEALTQAQCDEDAALIDTICGLINSFPKDAKKEHFKFAKQAIRWSSTSGPSKRGNTQIHDAVAGRLARVGEFGSAAHHYSRGESPDDFAAMVLGWAQQSYKSERDLLLARTVLMMLASGNLRDANRLYTRCGENERIFPTSPLTRYVGFLLKTLERDALPLFRLLRMKYAPSLQRDPALGQYLNVVGKEFYGLEPPRAAGLGGMLQGLLTEED